MGKIGKAANALRSENLLRRDEVVTNFMGGDSYKVNPLDTLKLITASSIFAEPSYYRDGGLGVRVVDEKYNVHPLLRDFSMLNDESGKTTTEIMEDAIDAALDYDFDGVLEWTKELRLHYNMRLNPQVIMVRAAVHPKRKEYTDSHKGKFGEVEQIVMRRADEPMSQIAYYIYLNGGVKANMPSVLKRALAKRLSASSAYEVNKYKQHEIGMIDAVRITHAHSQVLDELMQTGKVIVSDDKKTWEAMRSAGTDWKTIFHSVNMGHMALLRNLRGVFTEVNDAAFCDEYLAALVAGVEKGKQFPFRYYSAYMAVENSSCNHKGKILDALDACIDISLANMPKLKGKTMCLSDNSGSAWGTIPTEYGSVTVAEIDNLSSVITSACSDEGYVGKFGDKLKVFDARKKVGILEQAKAISRDHGTDVGMSTEGGIWEFFNNAIRNKEHWDNIFIYSDQQAGTGGLYGTQEQCLAYSKRGFAAGNGCFGSYINVFKLVQEYRKKVNPKVNVFSIQTAGYSNVVIPKYAYRTNLMYGWTGRESVFADAVIKEWDAIEAKQNI
jgi:hypothetical protein